MPKRFHQTILVTCVVPWDEGERLLADAFHAQVRKLILSGFRDLYVFGTASEGYVVDSDRFRQVCQTFRAATKEQEVHAQVGVIALSTANVVERIGVAYEMGFRIFQICLPSWGALNDRELMTFFRDVCGSFPDCRFLHYNLARAGRRLVAQDYRRIAAEVPNLVATKITGDAVREAESLLRIAPDLQHFFTEPLFAHACLYGECSLLSAYGPAIPGTVRRLFEYGRERRLPELFQASAQIAEFARELLAPAVGQTLMDGAYDKIIARVAGHDVPMRLLSPYEAFSEDVYVACEAIFRERFRAL